MRRRTWMRPATVLSVLVLLTASCGAEDPDEAPDAAAQPDTDESDTDEPETHDEAAEPADDNDAPVEPEEPSEEEGVGSGEPEQVTAYVVGYHWGWALFDEDGTELDVLEVSVGSEVELIAVNDHAGHAISQLPEPVAEAISAISWHERVHHDMDMGRIPDLEQAEGVSLDEALTIAHDGHGHTGPAPDHGLLVAGIGLEAFLDAHGDEPARLVFTVDEEGAHEFRCTEDCGPGHDYQRREMLVVTA